MNVGTVVFQMKDKLSINADYIALPRWTPPSIPSLVASRASARIPAVQYLLLGGLKACRLSRLYYMPIRVTTVRELLRMEYFGKPLVVEVATAISSCSSEYNVSGKRVWHERGKLQHPRLPNLFDRATQTSSVRRRLTSGFLYRTSYNKENTYASADDTLTFNGAKGMTGSHTSICEQRRLIGCLQSDRPDGS